MGQQTPSLYGRDPELAFVREMLSRPERDGVPASRHVPALVFTGPRGVGKTELLNGLAARFSGKIPFARFDCERLAQHLDDLPDGGSDSATTPKMLAVLAFQLSRALPRYGTLAFPRFIIGRLALENAVNVAAWDEARKQVGAAVSRYRQIGDPPEFLRELSGELATMIPAVGDLPGANTFGRHLPDVVYAGINVVVRRSWGAREGLDWYGSQDRGFRLDPLDELVELNRQAHQQGIADADDAVGHALFGAFLADIREGFAAGRRADARTLNCAILLDNVDTPPGREFLSRLIDAHSYRSRDVDFDPLTIVATSRTPLAEFHAQFGWDPVPVEDANYRNAVGNGNRGREVFSLQLGDLSYEAVGNMITALGSRVLGDRRATTAIYEFTHGHAAATCLLRDAIVELDFTHVNLTELLDRRTTTDSDAQPRVVGDRLLDILLPATPADVVKELVTASAARDLDEAKQMAEDSGLMPETRNRHEVVFARTIWSHVDESGHRTMPPMLRRLLLRRLAARGDEARRQVHSWLHESCQRRNDREGELYHLLAVNSDGLEPVARRMAERFTEMEIHEWLALLKAVCRAPNAFSPGPTPAERVRLLTSWSDERKLSPDSPHDPAVLAAVARLIAALWISADPLQQAVRDLRGEIRADYQQLASRGGDGRSALLDEADKDR